MDEALKLKPCPFAKCDSAPALLQKHGDYYVLCGICGTYGPGGYHKTAEAAADAWNDRTPEPWLPIETAPKDGTKVILRSISYNIQEQEIVRIMDNYWTNSGWRCHDPNYRFTHWQPLPAPPSKEGT